MKDTISLPGTPPRVSDVIIQTGVIDGLPESLETYLEGRVAYWIWDAAVQVLWLERVSNLDWPDTESGRLISFEASETNKRFFAVEDLGRQLVRAGADRKSALVAIGGGVTGDVVGFLASIYMRGIPHFVIPTTLLAQVDASVGGKTGIDLPEGKNLLGTFHQPRAVWIDPWFLETLSREEFRQGMAEVIKTAMLGNEGLWEYLEGHAEALVRRDSEALARVITACCRAKAQVVAADEREGGHRRILNLGHTVGHALERLSGYRMRHGDAVAIGLAAATGWAVRLGKASAETLARLEQLCTIWALPTRVPAEYPPEAVLEALQTDKKRERDKMHYVLPLGIGQVEVRDDLDWDGLRQVLAELQAP